MDLSIVIPTYNERENIPELLRRIEETLKDIDYEVIIVDDDSPDGTWKLAQNLSKGYPIKVIRRMKERGLATAVVRGFGEASSEFLAVMDADLQHPPEKLLQIYENLLKNYDIVIGSRKAEGGRIENWTLYRKIVSGGAEALCRLFIRESREIKDPLSGFFGIKRSVIQNTDLEPEGYKILLEILVKGNYDNVKEIPYTFRDRKEESSSMGFKNILNYLKHLLSLRISE